MYPKRYNHFMGCKTTILAPTPVHDFLHLLDLLSTSSSSSSSSSAIKKIHDGSVPVSGFSPSATVVFRLPSAKLFSWHRPPVDAAPRSRASIIPFPRGGGCEIYYDPPRPRPRLVIVRTVRTVQSGCVVPLLEHACKRRRKRREIAFPLERTSFRSSCFLLTFKFPRSILWVSKFVDAFQRILFYIIFLRMNTLSIIPIEDIFQCEKRL